MRSPKVSRLYLQVPPDEDENNWSDDRIWNEFRLRLAGLRAHNRWLADLCKEQPGRRGGIVQILSHTREILVGQRTGQDGLGTMLQFVTGLLMLALLD